MPLKNRILILNIPKVSLKYLIRHRDSFQTMLSATSPPKSVVICPPLHYFFLLLE